jgi:hypothetical protein
LSDLPGHFQLPCARPIPSYQQAHWLSRGCALTATHFPLDAIRNAMQPRSDEASGLSARVGFPCFTSWGRTLGKEAQSAARRGPSPRSPRVLRQRRSDRTAQPDSRRWLTDLSSSTLPPSSRSSPPLRIRFIHIEAHFTVSIAFRVRGDETRM